MKPHIRPRAFQSWSLLAAALLLSVSTGSGWSGGPWGSDSADETGGAGTYQGVMRGENLTGVALLSYSPQSESFGRYALFHEGAVYFGTTISVVNLPSRVVAGNLLGLLPLLAFDGTTTSFPGEDQGFSDETGSPSVSLTVRTAAEGSFDARIVDTAPIVKFEGQGVVTTYANNQVANDGGFTEGTSSQTVNTQPDTTNSDGDSQSVSSSAVVGAGQLRTMTPFEIVGYRTSLSPLTLISSFTYQAPQPADNAGPTPTPTPEQ